MQDTRMQDTRMKDTRHEVRQPSVLFAVCQRIFEVAANGSRMQTFNLKGFSRRHARRELSSGPGEDRPKESA